MSFQFMMNNNYVFSNSGQKVKTGPIDLDVIKRRRDVFVPTGKKNLCKIKTFDKLKETTSPLLEAFKFR